ncbi:YdjY domain-containing protein [Campylobacter geochelonis]|uniref:4Fe-4S ferredoxin-type domain-containing protein n=1 Tax=Campylobacter geochelonis TaxID=1780362 RepID=A0A128EC71_9BACT|nr:YdjY domain-containing protein [Campylobacter geochelonis]QKF70601.1 hypothetical protein CGEO_0268 [Campylobacter geochelonis]CZE45952.1 Uncharacterised protein [Campylobacter geochelonis]
MNIFKFSFLALVLMFLASCAYEVTDEKVSLNGVSNDKPMLVENGKITILAKVNGKYFDSPTRHLAVFKDGKFGDKSIFTSLANQNDFYNALITLGAKPGNNMNPKTADKTRVEGSKMAIKVAWKGSKEYDVNDVVIDSNSKPLDFRFGGNQERAKEINTGCVTCLDSCSVGIISNHTYTYGAVEKRKEVEFFGNKKVLPPDGTYVTLTYSLL